MFVVLLRLVALASRSSCAMLSVCVAFAGVLRFAYLAYSALFVLMI
jgi:hypothetical protein